MAETLKIGDVARLAGVGVDTIRFYEKRGVLPPAPRRVSGYRAFSMRAVERVKFVKSLQELGFALDDVIGLLQAIDGGRATCTAAAPAVRRVVDEIDARMKALRAAKRRIAEVVAGCEDDACALLDVPAMARRVRR